MISRSKEKGSTGATGEQSWRSLTRPPPIATSHSRWRRFRKRCVFYGLGLLAACIVGGSVFTISNLKKQGKEIRIKPPSEPIRRLFFHTNGVLPDRWLGDTVDLKLGMTLAEADIHAIKSRLEAEDQVKTASVERVFPDALRIVVEEYVPVLRMIVINREGVREVRMVSTEGSVYSGTGYDEKSLRIPFLRPYRYSDGRFKPLRGIPHLAVLLETCRRHHVDEFDRWRLVSLENYTGDLKIQGEVVEVTAIDRSGRAGSLKKTRIVFSPTMEFALQLDRLRHIREVTESIGDRLISVDLSLKDSAAVRFESGRNSLY